MDGKKCCFIGHRTINLSDELIAKVHTTIEELIIDYNVKRFLFGSRSEFDTLCHGIVTQLKDKYPSIVRVAYNTSNECPTLEKDRAEEEKKISELIKQDIHLMGYEEVCTPVEMCSSGKASYVERNYKMIDDSDICVFYYDSSYSPKRKCVSRKSVSGLWTSEKSGTSLAYKYAIKKKKQIINVFE